jgi:hypothetical protein
LNVASLTWYPLSTGTNGTDGLWACDTYLPETSVEKHAIATTNTFIIPVYQNKAKNKKKKNGFSCRSRK